MAVDPGRGVGSAYGHHDSDRIGIARMTDAAACWPSQFATLALGPDAARTGATALAIAPGIMGNDGEVTRAEFAMALNVALFADLLTRVPSAAAYVGEVVARGEAIVFDHGALRTIDGDTGALPSGSAAFTRILEPLGYVVAGTYPLPALRMTGQAFAQQDFPADIPQFFVSELHVGLLEPKAQAASGRVFGASRDPLGSVERNALEAFAANGTCARDIAATALPGIVATFQRQHELPYVADYETLRADSREAAWIATEGNAFNHATTRVPDVVALADRLRTEGKPIKRDVEISSSGRVRQTAFIADTVTRQFRTNDAGHMARLDVPGSFYEFISRDIDPGTGKLDLSFDSGNATGIFAVTAGR